MSWWSRWFGGEAAAPAPAPAPVDPFARRLADLAIDGVPDLIAALEDAPAPVRADVLRQARMRVGDHPPLLLALARCGPADAVALWTALTREPACAAEAHDALADLAESVRAAQAHRERAAAAAPGDAARLQRCLGDRSTQVAPRLPVGRWAPLIDRLPAAYTARAPIGQGAHAVVIRVAADAIWAAKGLRSDRADHPALDAIFADLAQVQALAHPGLVTIAHLDRAQGCWVRTLGERTLRPDERVDLAPVRAGIAALHAAGLAHGRVTRQNIIFDRTGRPRLTDVGLCRLDGVTPDPAADRAALQRLEQPMEAE